MGGHIFPAVFIVEKCQFWQHASHLKFFLKRFFNALMSQKVMTTKYFVI